MFETIAMFGGIIGGVVALLAIITFFLLKKNVVDILNKDAVLFDKNFEIKLKVINESMFIIDELSEKGKMLTLDAKFTARSKNCYNNLLCVASDLKLADQFYALAIDRDVVFNETMLAEYKLNCRRDIGLKLGKTLLISRTIAPKEVGENEAMLRANAANGTVTNFTGNLSANATTPSPVQQPSFNPVQPTQPTQPNLQNSQPMQSNAQENPNLMQRATSTSGQPSSMPPRQ